MLGAVFGGEGSEDEDVEEDDDVTVSSSPQAKEAAASQDSQLLIKDLPKLAAQAVQAV